MESLQRKEHNEYFLRRMLARRPSARAHYDELLKPRAAAATDLEAVADAAESSRASVLETIVDRERPVLFVKGKGFDTEEVTALGFEAEALVDQMKKSSEWFAPVLPLIGRFDVTNFPGSDFVGTGWFVDTDIVVTNRHVASLIARRDGRRFVFQRGVGGRPMAASFCNAHEYDDLPPAAECIFAVKDVLYIESDSGANDIAFVRVQRRTNGSALAGIPIASADVGVDEPVCVIGYPARATRRVLPNQALMEELYRARFDVKRAAPGYSMGTRDGRSEHDCTTLGGNSGSVLLDFHGQAVGLHFAGLYQQANYAVPASVLNEYIRRKRWKEPITAEINTPAAPIQLASSSVQLHVAPVGSGQGVITIPVTINIVLGTPLGDGPPSAVDAKRVEEGVLAYWDSRPQGVVAVRFGYFDAGERIGTQPCIVVSVTPDRWALFEATGLRDLDGVPIRYQPADVDEQIGALPALEAIDSIAYDDNARTAKKFSFAPVEEEMEVAMHVGPEYSWDQLQGFLKSAEGRLVSAMYEFHALHIKDAIEQFLGRTGASLKLVLDNKTFSSVRNDDEEFERVSVFADWAERFTFERVVAPGGTNGLIANAYHIKVAVREDHTFWLSSGNWKMGSSQPLITHKQRDEFGDSDLPGNREWHVIIKNKTLATRFRSHILQDFQCSTDLGGDIVPKRLLAETFVDVPVEEAIVLERRPPNRLLKPTAIKRRVKVRPLLTPDKEGKVFSEAVLDLIDSAEESLLFQIPYIGMPVSPRDDRGYIDELIRALTQKLKTLKDARLLLRVGGQKYSNPAHAAWYFKSKGVDIDERVHVIENHHTKGMIVDGQRLLLGSHNWSKPGVSLNRDASLLFDDAEIAAYYAEAFEIDWNRSKPVRPRRFVRSEAVVREAIGAAPPVGYRRVALSDWLGDDVD